MYKPTLHKFDFALYKHADYGQVCTLQTLRLRTRQYSANTPATARLHSTNTPITDRPALRKHAGYNTIQYNTIQYNNTLLAQAMASCHNNTIMGTCTYKTRREVEWKCIHIKTYIHTLRDGIQIVPKLGGFTNIFTQS
jgi:hypothetical protein